MSAAGDPIDLEGRPFTYENIRETIVIGSGPAPSLHPIDMELTEFVRLARACGAQPPPVNVFGVSVDMFGDPVDPPACEGCEDTATLQATGEPRGPVIRCAVCGEMVDDITGATS